MTSINSVSTTSVSSQTTEKESELSSATKAQLEALGIDPSTVSSESQAQALIANAQGESFKNMVSNGEQTQTDSAEETYLREAKALATAVGAVYSNDDSLEDILSSVSAKLNQMMSSAGMNPSQIQMIQMYQNQLDQISSGYSQAQSASLYSSMDLISNNNRYSLGL